MVLCNTLQAGGPNCYMYNGKYLGKFVKTERMQIGYSRNEPPDYQTVYTFEIPWKPSKNPLNNVPSLYGTDDVKIVPCKTGGKRKNTRAYRKKRNNRTFRN